MFIPWFTLAYHKNMVLSIFYAIILLGIIDGTACFIIQKYEPRSDIIQATLFFQLGASISLFFSTLMLRLCGFRMVRGAKPTCLMTQ